GDEQGGDFRLAANPAQNVAQDFPDVLWLQVAALDQRGQRRGKPGGRGGWRGHGQGRLLGALGAARALQGMTIHGFWHFDKKFSFLLYGRPYILRFRTRRVDSGNGTATPNNLVAGFQPGPHNLSPRSFLKGAAMPDFSQLTERQQEIYDFIRS